MTTPLFIPYLPDVAALPLRVVGDDTSLVVACGAFSQDPIHVPCLLLPAPIAHLIFKGCWHDVLLLARWNLQLASATVSPANLWGEWPSMDFIRQTTGRDEPAPALHPFSATTCLSLASDIRRWATMLRQSSVDELSCRQCQMHCAHWKGGHLAWNWQEMR